MSSRRNAFRGLRRLAIAGAIAVPIARRLRVRTRTSRRLAPAVFVAGLAAGAVLALLVDRRQQVVARARSLRDSAAGDRLTGADGNGTTELFMDSRVGVAEEPPAPVPAR
jgi:hypothetical protein